VLEHTGTILPECGVQALAARPDRLLATLARRGEPGDMSSVRAGQWDPPEGIVAFREGVLCA
jgi:hypothetical protein